ncbi:MAG: T9SS type A sorting domain-containing protein [Ignavibacteria bacterium]|nr:T9SS type A sorting domain-containing protein [Ignavibacteria bacterium]
MTNFILVLILIMNYSNIAVCDQPDLFTPKNNTEHSYHIIPDVMNKVQVLENNINKTGAQIYDADSLPVFPGFPKVINGQSTEGGIYCQMDTDSDMEIVYGIGTTIQAWNIDGSIVTGWPKTLTYNTQGAPAYGDIDGDGEAEIVIGTANVTGVLGILYAFEKNGTPVTGFPINNGGSTRSVVLCDLDMNGSLEIITTKRLSSAGEIYVFKGDGTVYPGWPKSINHVPASGSAAGDINGDGIPEIISESYTSLYAWDRNGNPVTGFPFVLPNGDVNSYSSPVLADVDGDNIREIIFGSHQTGGAGLGYLYILKNNGTILPNWPKTTTYWIYGPPVLGYLNDDNVIDIVVGDQIGGALANFVYAWDKNGNVLSGFPVGPVNAVNNQVALGDIDNDGKLELLVDDNTQENGMGKYSAFNHDGTPLSGWPLPTSGTTMFNMPCLIDLNNDGTLDIVGAGITLFGSNQTSVYIWNAGVSFNVSKIVNPVFQFNVRHNGVYGDNNLVSIGDPDNEIASGFILHQNFPNPFNPTTSLEFVIPEKGFVTLKVYDILGNEVTALMNQNLSPGSYLVQWNGEGFASGVYFYELSVTGLSAKFKETKRMLLIK